ncbi:MAG: hypothetical protein OEV49_05385 [candidate division Zixibacteria bacterium]|nr:hypothetical protein [candidate division Zixibacteria bacterium]MDH3936709.1 hypothetical protein [candidate division Zixibacteria bacterium]MDH4032562.1 hypothetical protein [candidate division Zixibacteria bacterium]
MSSMAMHVLQELDRGLISVDIAERLLLAGQPRTEIPTPFAMTLPTMFTSESSVLWM